jgi:catechol 2,3-dioxygenase-like lactoylglutathione lyase family enzyme
MPPVEICAIDHLVLTVGDVERATEFYRSLGLVAETFGEGRRAVRAGSQRIHLHPATGGPLPRAARPTPGSGDLCLLVAAPIDEVARWLEAAGIAVEEGPVPRTGAAGPLVSLYVRDPDGNLVELARPA